MSRREGRAGPCRGGVLRSCPTLPSPTEGQIHDGCQGHGRRTQAQRPVPCPQGLLLVLIQDSGEWLGVPDGSPHASGQRT